MNGIKITLFLLIVMHVLPIAVTQLLILEYPFKERKSGRVLKWAVTAGNILLNGLFLYETIVVYSNFDLIEIFDFACTYQDISRLAFSNVFSMAMSVLIGIGLYTYVCKHYHDERSPRFSGKCILLILIAVIPIIQGYYYGYSGASNFSIVEVCRKTTVVDTAEYPLDEDAIGDGVCYVTVINSGVLTYELDQMYLSDNLDNLREQQFFQSLEIKPGETYRFYMSKEDSLDIKKSGGLILYLSNKYGNVVDHVEVPALKENEIYKKLEAGWQIVKMEENGIIAVPLPSFSHEGGFYNGAFELELTANPGTTIYYTLDSSNPTAESMEYSGPIYVYDRSEEENQYSSFVGEKPVDKCFVVRAAAVDSDGSFSDIITKSYFINQEKYKDKTVISLVSDPDGLFGDNGIYVAGKEYDEWYSDAVAKAGEDGEIDTSDEPTKNYLQRGIEWERESNLEVFKNAEMQLNQPVGIRIQGANARDYSLKRFSIFARDKYGSSDYFDVNLINDYRQHSLYLREGDLHAMSQLLGKGRNVATTDFVTVDVFLDGEFWYTTYLHEKFKERNFAEKYNLAKDNIVISTNWWIYNDVADLTDFISQHNLADDKKYFEFNEMLDIQSYIDWHCFNAFLLNLDLNERLNCLFWHTIIPEDNQLGDSRWRLGLYDMDLKWYTSRPYEENPFTRYDIDNWPIYSALKESEIFCRQYVLTFMDLINTNFSVENTTAIMEELSGKNTMTIVKELSIEHCRDFFENRAAYVVPHLAEEFELTGTQETVTLSSNVAGTPITLNTISPELQPSDGAFSWTGCYFTDYPVSVTANASNFSHWEVTVNGDVQTFTDATIEVPVTEGGIQIYAAFK